MKSFIHNKSSKCRAFTLVELLVVISIIAMLLAVLMPALGKARELAIKIICKTNLRGIGLATNLYCEDNAGRFPAPYKAYGYEWYQLLAKYVGMTKDGLDKGATRKHNIFVCPSSNHKNRLAYRDYAVARWSPSGYGGDPKSQYGVLGYYNPTGNSKNLKYFFSRKLTDIRRPLAQVVLFAEFPNDDTYTSDADTFILTSSANGYSDKSKAFLLQFGRRHDKGKWVFQSGDNRSLDTLNKGGDNALMLDGHVEFRKGSSTEFLRADFSVFNK